MKTIYFLLLIAAALHSDVWDPDGTQDVPETQKEVLIISLGSHCLTASLIRNSGLRSAAYPFDWLLSLDNEGVVQMLDDDFAYFLDEEFLAPDSLLLPKAHAESLVHLKYHVEFVHEGNFRSNCLQNIQRVKEKYARRIERFKNLAHFPGTVYFVRCNYLDGQTDIHRSFKFSEIVDISDADAIRIHASLKKRFPELKFKLIIVNQSSSMEERISMEQIDEAGILKTRANFTSNERLYQAYAQFFHSLLVDTNQ
ncbi:MAG: papain-like cysteine peptidase [Parachlamydiales bacterium]|nr:papain-like cysteine peptidase [Parachlamydiales bacterium]